MTTILADARRGLMAADTGAGDGDRQWCVRKVWRVHGALVGLAGDCTEMDALLEWFRARQFGQPPHIPNATALVLTPAGMLLYDFSTEPTVVASGREAIGTGAKGAMCAYEALGFTDPRRAVQIACRHDAGSRAPVRLYRL